MAIEARPGTTPTGPALGPPPAQPWWIRPGAHTGIIIAAGGYFLGHWLGNFLSSGYQQNPLSDSNDVPIVLGYALGVLGWLIGLGVFGDLGRLAAGIPLSARHAEADEFQGGLAKYFRYTLDHKVVGIQYLFGMTTYFLTGGLFAMAIRTELLSPAYHLISPSSYLMVVGEHGTMMMMMTSVILGPFGQYLAPLMIGSKRMAFPRTEALAFWLTPAAYIILLSGVLLGGFPNGWTGYAPLGTQSTPGADAYFFSFGLMALSMLLAGFNIIATIITCRAPGMRWSRLPIFIWAMFTVSFVQVLAGPVLSISSFFLGASLLIFLINFVMSTLFWRERAAGNLWESRSLEWMTSSPPPPENFERIPVILTSPYQYGSKDAPPVADLSPPPGVIGAAYAAVERP